MISPTNVGVGNSYTFSFGNLNENSYLMVYAYNSGNNGWGASAPTITNATRYAGTYAAYQHYIWYIVNPTSSTVTFSGNKPNTGAEAIVGFECWSTSE